MDKIVDAVSNIAVYLQDLSSNLNSVDFAQSGFSSFIGQVRYCLGDGAWIVLSLYVSIGAGMLMFKGVKQVVEFISSLWPF